MKVIKMFIPTNIHVNLIEVGFDEEPIDTVNNRYVHEQAFNWFENNHSIYCGVDPYLDNEDEKLMGYTFYVYSTYAEIFEHQLKLLASDDDRKDPSYYTDDKYDAYNKCIELMIAKILK